MTLKVVVPKGKQAAAVAALQAVGIGSIEDWATAVEGMLMERKAYVEDVGTDYKEYSTSNGAYIFQMEFIGTEGQLYNVFYTPGVVDALQLISPYAVSECMMLATASGHYFICYGGGDVEVYLPPQAQATPLPAPVVPLAPARTTTQANPFTEPTPRMPPVVEAVSTAPVSPVPSVERVIDTSDDSSATLARISDTSDSILTLNVYVPFTCDVLQMQNLTSQQGSDLLVHYKKESLKDYAVSEWVHFYDEVALPIEKKSYDIKEVNDGVELSATFRAHVDKFGDVISEEALHHLEEAVQYADTDIFYVEMPAKNEEDGKTYYVKNYSEFIRVGPLFHWSFGGVEGGDVKVEIPSAHVVVPPVQEVLPPIQVAEVISPQEVPQPSPKDKAVQRVAELKANAEAIRAEVSELKKARTKLNSEINEKEARIRAFEFASDELRDVFGF
jgi:hypothetical protein